MRILVTGANGFLGRHVVSALINGKTEKEIHAVRSPYGADPRNLLGRYFWHTADLLDSSSTKLLLERVRPTHIIHLAWITTHGVYWNSAENYLWLEASIRLLDEFIRLGGQRFIQIGTCAEYDWSESTLIEGISPEQPSTLYGRCKLAFHHELLNRNEMGLISTANGRVFFAYGPFENPARLVPSACRAIIENKKIEFNNCSIWRDYMHVADLATSIVCLTDSTLNGSVNLASGEPIRLSAMLEELVCISQRGDLFVYKEQPENGNSPPILIADTRRIRSIGWTPSISLYEGLSNTYHWWQSNYT